MSFLRKLFGAQKKRPPEAMRGLGTAQSDEDQRSTRSRMEAEMISDRERRAGNRASPGDLAPNALSPSDKEEAVIALVTRACAGRDLQTTRVDVRKLEGDAVPTLRFTLDDRASTDLERERIATSDESVEALASIVVAELRRQAGP